MTPSDVPSEAPDRGGRFFRIFGVWLIVVATVTTVAFAVHAGFGLRKFGGLEYVPRMVAFAVVRELCAGMIFAAGLLTWVTVSHGLPATTTQARFRPNAIRELVAGVLGFPLAVAVSCLTGLLVCVGVWGVSVERYVSAWKNAVAPMDYAIGLVPVAQMEVLLLFTGWLSVPVVGAAQWPLWKKLSAVIAVLVAIALCLRVWGSYAPS